MVIHRARHAKPTRPGNWNVRRIGDAEGVPKSTAQRWFALHGVKPHLAETFKLSNDPFVIKKVRDITALYLNPPEHAVALCVDEKTRIQALGRTRPALPTGLGHFEGYRHDYVCHGTTALFAALDVATGKGIARCRKRHRHEEWLAFLRLIDRETPEGLDLHLVCDNYATHKHAQVRAWVAGRPRIHLHFIPTYASWLKQVGRWFGLLSERATSPSVTELKQRIMDFTEQYNRSSKPFVWVATADSIFEKLDHIRKRINRTPH